MKFLAVIKEKDVFPEKKTSEDGVRYEDRPTGKAIVFDEEGKIALVGTKVNSYYLLPGGGIDPGESVEDGIVRECLEEIGCDVRLDRPLGIIEDYRTRDKKHCINYCYTAKLRGEKGKLTLTEEEIKNGLHVIWVPPEKAIAILKDETEQLKRGEVTFYNTGFNILRDFHFLNQLSNIGAENERIYLFTDYRGRFYSSTKYRGAAVDIPRLETFFNKLGFELFVRPFSSINFRTQDYANKWVLYQSSEDPGLFYRSYVDDIILGLHHQGAKLIPNIFQHRAHHNKHFMEILRDLQNISEVKNVKARRYGTYEDYQNEINNLKESDFVLKSSNTSKSRGVYLLKSLKEKIDIPKFASRTLSTQNIRYFIEWIKTGKKPLVISNNRHKFVLQQYVSGLKGDYRIVIYGNKYYVLYRENRPNDFRASGSMRFHDEIELPTGILDYSRKIFENFEVPYIALDIGFDDKNFYLFEFQFISFGQYTLEKSKFFYQADNEGKWNKVYETPDLEREISSSVAAYIKKRQ